MSRRYGEVFANRETRAAWLKVGQKVVIRADKHSGRLGTITAVDRRFNKPYTVKVVLASGRTISVNYAARGINIIR